jgi:hypothetical protein
MQHTSGLAHAREAVASAQGARHIPELMVGSPIKRIRKAGVTDPITGELVRFPYMPRVADLPPGWQQLSTAEKIEHLLGMPLDGAAAILSWGPNGELDPIQLSMQMQVWRIVFMIGVKALLNGKLGREFARERDRQRLLGELERAADARQAARANR